MDSYNNVPENNKKKPIAIIYCILCTLFLSYAVLFTALPAITPMGFLALSGFAVCYSVLLTKRSIIACIIPPAVVATAVVAIPKNGMPAMFMTFLGLAGIIFGLMFAAALSYCSAKKLSGGVTFAILSFVSVFSICATLLLVIAEIYGDISIETVSKAFDDASAYMSRELTAYLDAYLSDMEADADVKASMLEMGKALSVSMMQTFPSMVAMLGMAYGAVTKILYKPAVKCAEMTDACIDNREWRFMLSPVSAVMFELIFIANIIMSLFNVGNTIALAFMNVEAVLTLPFAYIGLRQLKDILKEKVNSKAASVAIVAVGAFILMTLTGGLVLTIAALFGASYVNRLNIQQPKG